MPCEEVSIQPPLDQQGNRLPPAHTDRCGGTAFKRLNSRSIEPLVPDQSSQPQRSAASSTMPAGVVAMLALAALLNYVDRGNLATAAPVLQDELALSSSQIGLLLSAFFWAYAPSQLLAGWLVHRYDIRLVLGAGVLLWSAATTLTGLANGFVTLLLLRLLLGLGESVTFPSWALILARHSAEGDRGRLNGLVSSGQGFGPVIGTLFGGLAIAHFGWRPLFGEILRQRAFWGSALGQSFMNIGFYFVISSMPSFPVKAGAFTVSHMAIIAA